MSVYSKNPSAVVTQPPAQPIENLPAIWPTEGQPSLSAFRARLLPPELPREYLEPLVKPRRGIFAWFWRKSVTISKPSFISRPFRFAVKGN